MPGAEAALIVLGDLAWLRREAVERVIAAAAAADAEALRAFDHGHLGQPLMIHGSLLRAARSAPDAGLRELLKRSQVDAVECAGLGVCRDVDTRADLPG